MVNENLIINIYFYIFFKIKYLIIVKYYLDIFSKNSLELNINK